MYVPSTTPERPGGTALDEQAICSRCPYMVIWVSGLNQWFCSHCWSFWDRGQVVKIPPVGAQGEDVIAP